MSRLDFADSKTVSRIGTTSTATFDMDLGTERVHNYYVLSIFADISLPSWEVYDHEKHEKN
jgi:hypothetical protein